MNEEKKKNLFPNQCLGILENGKRCENMLKKGTHFCKKCKNANRNKRLSKTEDNRILLINERIINSEPPSLES